VSRRSEPVPVAPAVVDQSVKNRRFGLIHDRRSTRRANAQSS
jgi:hypothetical protein